MARESKSESSLKLMVFSILLACIGHNYRIRPFRISSDVEMYKPQVRTELTVTIRHPSFTLK